jgi:hypothetical protein
MASSKWLRWLDAAVALCEACSICDGVGLTLCPRYVFEVSLNCTAAELGSEHLSNKTARTELRPINKEIAENRKKLAVLEARKAEIERAMEEQQIMRRRVLAGVSIAQQGRSSAAPRGARQRSRQPSVSI